MRRHLVTPLHGTHVSDLRGRWGMARESPRLCSKLCLPPSDYRYLKQLQRPGWAEEPHELLVTFPLHQKHMLRKCSWRNLRHWRSRYAVKTSRTVSIPSTVSTPSTRFILPAYTTTQMEGWFVQWEWEKLVKYIYGIQWKKCIKN